MKVLLVEDDRRLASAIAKNLKMESFAVDHAYDGPEAEELAGISSYDVIILDVGLPRQDGFTTCANIRQNGTSTPILMLTAMNDVSDKVKGLDSGADDYLTKPFYTTELVARIRALMRRPHQVTNPVFEKFGLTINTTNHEVQREGKNIVLSVQEYALLELLVRRPGEIVTRQTIMDSLWDMNDDPRSNVIDAAVKLLRQKIDKGFSFPLIHTMRGIGYRFAKDVK
jgi:two-component system OmpR family response regulator